MKLLFLLILLIAAGTGVFSYAQTTKKNTKEFTVDKFDPSRDAAKDIQLAVIAAKKSGKNILLDVGGDWCIWCHRLDKFFEDNKDVADYLHANYIVVNVNYSKENKNEKVLAAYPVIPGYPHIFVLDKNGKLIVSQDTGELEKEGGHDHDKVLTFLKKFAPQKG